MKINQPSNTPIIYQFKNVNTGTVFCPIEERNRILMKVDTVTDEKGDICNTINLNNGLFWYIPDDHQVILMTAEINVEVF